MIDLHTHTIYSDGTDSVTELLKKANNIDLDIISITDHNSVKSYIEIDKNPSLKSLFKGKIIVGCEFTTTYKGQLIEILGYNIKYKKINNYLKKYYSPKKIKYYANILYNRTIDKLISLGYTLNLPRSIEGTYTNEFFNVDIYNELIKYEENNILLKQEGFSCFSEFFRKGLTNPRSNFFIPSSDLKPSLDEILKKIHQSKGIAFVAHPYQYEVVDMNSFLNDITSNHAIDGIECYHTTFSKEQSNMLLNFCKNHHLLISGGSDYHGKNKKNHELGHLNINNDIIKNWNI